MNKETKMPRWHSPFDDSARGRLRRMGLLLEDGSANREALTVMAQVYAGQYFDDVCASHQDMEILREQLRRYVAGAEMAAPKQRFLLLCLQYDAFYRPIPDPVWWMSGSEVLTDQFSQMFVACLRKLLEGM